MAVKEIVKRETAPVSAMPPTFAAMLAPQDVADIVAYLQAPKKKKEEEAKPAAAEKPGGNALAGMPDPLSGKQWGDRKKGFHLDCHDVRLELRYDGVEIGSYIYRHSETKRPFFAHVKTPSGIQVTRNFPPIEGKDPTDHGSMHPGISLGFARLNGISFWHNKAGVVVHDGIVGEPKVGAESASWMVRNRWLAPGGKLVCRETARYQFEKNADGYLLRVDNRFSGDEVFEFGVIEEMGLAIRVATPIMVKGQGGAILSGRGGVNEKGTWGKVDDWWDYHGPIGGRSVGLQVMSGNGDHEVWSHSRDYGVLVANPLPVDRAENRGKSIVVEPGEEFRLRFGVQVHEHARREEFDPAAAYRRYLAGLQEQR